MAWDTGLREALVAYGPSGVTFELRPDGVAISGVGFWAYPIGGSTTGMSLGPFGGLSNPMIMLLTVAEYNQGAMDWMNRTAGRPAPSPRLLDNVILGNMAAPKAQRPIGNSGSGAPILFEQAPLPEVDLPAFGGPAPDPAKLGALSISVSSLSVLVEGDGGRTTFAGTNVAGVDFYRLSIPNGSPVPITIRTGLGENVIINLHGSRVTVRELTDVTIPAHSAAGEMIPIGLPTPGFSFIRMFNNLLFPPVDQQSVPTVASSTRG